MQRSTQRRLEFLYFRLLSFILHLEICIVLDGQLVTNGGGGIGVEVPEDDLVSYIHDSFAF